MKSKLVFLLFFSLLTTYLTSQVDTLMTISDYWEFDFNESEIQQLVPRVNGYKKASSHLRSVSLPNQVSPSFIFNPIPPGTTFDTHQLFIDWNIPTNVDLPSNQEELAFYPVHHLSSLILQGKITSTELTRFFINRLKQHGDTLQCVITLTEELALSQAAKADQEIQLGRYRGPLHGIPYGAKDLLSVPGYRTTWGAMPFKDQIIEDKATVIERLEEAGAVLVAKLTLGALAMGDIWYGGKTRNPWNLAQGSSGSSAGSASATVSGLVPFAIGSETWGSIISPSTRCGATGLRPTFGTVSRHGAMALSWTMDKLGPICRNAEDCALVFDAIRGSDGKDLSVTDAAFNYDPQQDAKTIRVGYFKNLFDQYDHYPEKNDYILKLLSDHGINLQPVQWNTDLPISSLSLILMVEAAAAFDELSRSNRDDQLVQQTEGAWPNQFRAAHYIPAVDYVQANRVRTLLINELQSMFQDYDVILAPTFGDHLLATNLTGHPAIVLPSGFTEDGSPLSITILGKLYGEASMIRIAALIQELSDFEDQIPPLFRQ